MKDKTNEARIGEGEEKTKEREKGRIQKINCERGNRDRKNDRGKAGRRKKIDRD